MSTNLPKTRATNLVYAGALTRPQHDHILLDGSGSMHDKWWEMLDAIDAYVAGLKTAQVNSHITLSVFTDGADLDLLQRDCHINNWHPLTEAPIGSTWGGTALYDAINIAGRRLRDLNPGRCSFLICTDGSENGSKFTDLTQAKAILDWMRARGWQVTFIGCDFNNSRQAALLGAGSAESIGVQKKLLSDAARNLASKRAAYGFNGTPMHFSEAEQQQFGGYLTAK